jgi:hypothetical protein
MAHTERHLCRPPSYSFIQIQRRHKACQRVFNGNRPGSDDPDVEEYTVVHGIQSCINVSKLSTLILRQINPVPHIFNLHLSSQIVSSLPIQSCKQIMRKCGNVTVSFVLPSLQWGRNIRSVIIWQWALSAIVLSQSFY